MNRLSRIAWISLPVVGLLSAAWFFYPADPSRRLETRFRTLEGAKIAYAKDPKNTDRLVFSEISYDINKTTSTVTPLVSDLRGNWQYLENEGEPNVYSFTANLALQDGDWIVTEVSTTICGGPALKQREANERTVRFAELAAYPLTDEDQEKASAARMSLIGRQITEISFAGTVKGAITSHLAK